MQKIAGQETGSYSYSAIIKSLILSTYQPYTVVHPDEKNWDV